ncbi:hypothetical protein LHV13_07310 [Ferrovum sp. PN-J185]|nr:hypothetical protein [Ferrovum sp. PN-J185]MCC6068976.1 hypothetical protein [Ferrovum sp. PN-J185]MDE1891044.1 hypothetical protein [Betaproteobacteria bacterium]MDE2055644.1 hypothetical protein [Betaproteobacteria bacterium]
MWDTYIAIAIVVVAAVYLVKQWTGNRSCHESSTCNNCQSTNHESEHHCS